MQITKQEVEWMIGNATAALDKTDANLRSDSDAHWVITAGALVFFMQCGFAMLEAGCVRSKNTMNILFKNLMDACIAAILFWALGYGFAYGEDGNGFIGAGNFFLNGEADDESGQHMWFFQFAFAATAATIVSGSVAERTKLSAYFIYSAVITAFIYPVVVHWVWGADGWLSAWTGDQSITLFASAEKYTTGMIDYAGSGVVHMVGGFAGLAGAIVVGPRKGRFETLAGGKFGAPLPIPGQNTRAAALGVFILWFGWYGFNCGSTLVLDGNNAGKVATTTTLAAAAACLTTLFFVKFTSGTWDLGAGLNGVLAGLVSITAPCSTVDELPALVIGIVGGFVYVGAKALLLKLKVDDPLDACPIHGFCGAWGCLAVGIFAQWRNIKRAYGMEEGHGLEDTTTDGTLFAIQLCGVLAIAAWTLGTSFAMFYAIDKTVGMRVDETTEEDGLDVSEHGGEAYEWSAMVGAKQRAAEEGRAVEMAAAVSESVTQA